MLGDATEQRAARTLGDLTRRRALFRQSAGPKARPMPCFTMRPRPPHDRELRRDLAVLAHCWLRPHPSPLVTPARLDAILGGMAQTVDLGTPPFQPCVLLPAPGGGRPRVGVIRVAHSDDLQAVVEQMDQHVSSPVFRVWWWMVRHDAVALVVLLPGPQHAAHELGRWLRRRPPVSRIAEPALPVPVHVFEVDARLCATKKDKRPEGLLPSRARLGSPKAVPTRTPQRQSC